MTSALESGLLMLLWKFEHIKGFFSKYWACEMVTVGMQVLRNLVVVSCLDPWHG